MKHWGIQARMTLLALGPATLIACLLTIYFTFSRIGDAEQGLRELGVATAQHVASSAEYGVVTGNGSMLQNLVKSAVKEGHTQFVLIVDNQMKRLAQAGTMPPGLELSLRAQAPHAVKWEYVFIEPIRLSKVDLQDTFLLDDAATDASQADKPLGWAVVAMSPAPLVQSKKQMLAAGLAIAFAGLALTAVLALLLGRSVSRPVRKLSQVVEAMGRGNLGARVAPASGGELLLLQTGFNRMADALQANQTELQQRIHEATADLALKKDEAENANRAKSSFLAAVSHDLRQPMHAIGLFAATLKQRVTTPEQAELVQRIEDSVGALQAMFDALLNISRLDAGMLEAHLEPCDLAILLKRVGREFQPLAEQKNLNLRIRVCPAWVMSDAMLLGRIISNLMANAIRYTERGGVLLACRRWQGQWVVQIWDTGIGVGADHLPHIFEEYYQVGNAERNHAQGMGLGLAIVQRIARLLGYRVEVRSRPSRGSVFSITLPSAQPLSDNRRSNRARTFGMFKGEHVLLIEDDQAALESMQGLLSSWGLAPQPAANLEQAIIRIKQDVPKLIICDYRLPQTTGVDVVKAIRAQLGEAVLAVLVSGDTAPEAVALMQASGLPVLYKPVRPAKLRALISRLLDSGDDAKP